MDILQNEIIQALIVFVTANAGVISALCYFFRKLKRSTKNVEQNSESFVKSTEELNEIKQKYISTLQELDTLRLDIKTIKERQALQVCNDVELIESGKASAIMEVEYEERS